MIRPMTLPGSITPALTRPTARTVTAEEDCTTEVKAVPNRKALKRFFVMKPVTLSNRLPVIFPR